MLTSPQRMLLEMDERSRELERLVKSGDVDATTAFYANTARSGRSDIVRQLAILGDEAAQQAIGLINDNNWSQSTKLERHVGDNQDRELAIMIADELFDDFFRMVDDEFGASPVAGDYYLEITLIREYYHRYDWLRRQSAAEHRYVDLEYELRGESNQGGRLANLPFDNIGNFIRSLAGGVGLACLIRTADFEASSSNNQYRPGMSVYVGNALQRAEREGISTTDIMDRIRQRLQAQLF